MSDSILRKMFEVQPTNWRRLDQFRNAPVAEVTCEKGPEVDHIGSSFQSSNQYKMLMQVGVMFNATDSELERAKRIAFDRCSSIIYGPLHAALCELESHVSDGDKDACFEAIANMRDMMRAK